MSVRFDDPCAYCNRPLREVAEKGCGSKEFGADQERANSLCAIYEREIRRKK